mmetsp:Transcript_52347/g.162181  ORF Transcript_52347/g.162181 Transcript_52347/m.162181 type:complete len:258 (-) Transcript_52347:203-976(-)
MVPGPPGQGVAHEAAQEAAQGGRDDAQGQEHRGLEAVEARLLEVERGEAHDAPGHAAEGALGDDDAEGGQLEVAPEPPGLHPHHRAHALPPRGWLARGLLHLPAHQRRRGQREQAHGQEGQAPAGQQPGRGAPGGQGRGQQRRGHHAHVQAELDPAEGPAAAALRGHVRHGAVGHGPEAGQHGAVERAQDGHVLPPADDGHEGREQPPACAARDEDGPAGQDAAVGEDAPDGRRQGLQQRLGGEGGGPGAAPLRREL